MIHYSNLLSENKYLKKYMKIKKILKLRIRFQRMFCHYQFILFLKDKEIKKIVKTVNNFFKIQK